MIVADKQIPFLREWLAPFHDVRAVDAEEITNNLLQRTNASALFVRSVTLVNKSLLTDTNVSFVGTATAGTDHIDEQYLAEHNIRFSAAPGCNANAVAEYVMHHIGLYGAVKGATIGIVGFGNVGCLVARYARQQGLCVLVSDPPLESSAYRFPRWVEVTSLGALLERSNIVTLHVPFTDAGAFPTSNLIDSPLLNRCKQDTLLINTSRGGIVNETALTEVVAQARMSAVVDVFANEPNVDPHVCAVIPMCTPHIAGYSLQAKYNGAAMVYAAYTGKQAPPLPLPTSNGIQDVYYPYLDGTITAKKFNELRRLMPVRLEHSTPPTWDECNVART